MSESMTERFVGAVFYTWAATVFVASVAIIIHIVS